MKNSKNTVTLYDAGGVIIVLYLFGIPFGSIFDYLWNQFVLSGTLRFLPSGNKISISKERKWGYTLFITALGVIIDWAYFELTWDTYFGKNGLWIPAMAPWLQVAWMALPLTMLFLVNAVLSYSFLKLDRRQAVITGISMAVFTAPWLLVIVPYAFGWVS